MKSTNNIKISRIFSAYLLLAGMVWPTYEAASWQLKTSGYAISKVKYSIFGKGLKEHEGYYFPEYASADQALYVGFKPIRFQRISALAEALDTENKKIYAWKTEFEPPIRCLDQVTFLYRRIYTRNVSEYTIYIQSSRTEKWYKKRIKIPFKGYQIPSYDAISHWEQLINEDTREESWFLNEINNSDKIGQLVIVVNPVDMDFNFVIGDLRIVDREIGYREFHHPFFDSILDADSAQHIEKDSFYDAPGIPALLLPISWYAMHENYGPIFHFDPGHREVDAGDIRDLKVKVIKRILDLYPFYEERGLDRQRTLDRATAFADSKPELAAPGATPERLEHLREHGFVIITDFVDNPWIPVLREAARRVTEACAPEHGYSKIDCSKGYVHRAGGNEPWAIRGLIHPAFEEPCFAEFHGSDDFLNVIASWCNGLGPEDMVLSSMLLFCNPRRHENGPSWHRDVTWWGSGKPYFSQRDNRGESPEGFSEEVEKIRWEEIRANNAKSLANRNGVNIFLALVDDECHELIPGSHERWRTPFEHDVLLPQSMKDQGVPYTPSWNRKDPLPGQVAIRLKPGEALIRNRATIHTGHTVPERERNTLFIGWSKWSGPFSGEPAVADARNAWQLDPSVREALPYEWMQTAWDRWAETQKLGDRLEDRYAGFDIQRIKAGEVVGWRSELERQAAAAGEA